MHSQSCCLETQTEIKLERGSASQRLGLKNGCIINTGSSHISRSLFGAAGVRYCCSAEGAAVVQNGREHREDLVDRGVAVLKRKRAAESLVAGP
jgi:hypothetical protein